ncbi:hypothetical protein [Mesorhizobium sp. NPDC059025]|uniref:hypothetical protein n=1 Tax=unclassified Mesorhizobium TaxID=325217 RepID=UPI0036822C2E
MLLATAARRLTVAILLLGLMTSAVKAWLVCVVTDTDLTLLSVMELQPDRAIATIAAQSSGTV